MFLDELAEAIARGEPLRCPLDRARALGWDVHPTETPGQRGVDLARLYKQLNLEAQAWRDLQPKI